MSNLSKIADQLSELTVLEMSKLVKELEEKWGVSAAAPVAVAVAPNIAAPVAAEKSSFEVVLTNAGSSKINVIKVVREVTGLGLQEANALVSALPKAVKSGISKEDAESMKKKLEEAGATVELK